MFDPDYIRNNHFGVYGGRYTPEAVIPALEELEKTYFALKNDEAFQNDLTRILKEYVGRPTPLYYAENLTKRLGAPKIYLKLEGLAHTGAHKINNAIGQALLAKKLGKTRIVAETGAGQHGLAAATVAAKFKLECEVFMGAVDYARQRPNVFWMERLGAKVTSVSTGGKTLKDAVNEAMKQWASALDSTHYLIGSAVGPYPFPVIVRDFQSVIGRETKAQIMEREARLPSALIACVGGGSNASGFFYPFLSEESVALIGVEGGGEGLDGKNAIRAKGKGKPGIVESYKSYFIQTEEGQVAQTHSIAAGLDYAGVSPELAHLKDIGRVEFSSAEDAEALNAVSVLAEEEGIFPALESAHAIGFLLKNATTRFKKDDVVVVNVSGRGDKDLFILANALSDASWKEFLRYELER